MTAGYGESPGSGYSGIVGESPKLGDDLDEIMQQIGKLSASQDAWSQGDSPYVDPRQFSDARKPLEDRAKSLQEIEDLQKQKLKMELSQQGQNNKSGFGGHIGDPYATNNDMHQPNFSGDEVDPNKLRHAYDPFRSVREAAIAAARKVLTGR